MMVHDSAGVGAHVADTNVYIQGLSFQNNEFLLFCPYLKIAQTTTNDAVRALLIRAS